MNRKISQTKGVKGIITVPGDKSISHRALLLGAIAEGETTIYNCSGAVDVNSTLQCLIQLGIQTTTERDTIKIKGTGLYGLKSPALPLNCGNSGTTMRLLAGILAAQPFTSTLVGDASLSSRPMKRIIDPLVQMGGHILSQPGGLAPLTIHGNPLRPICYHSPIASAQVKSCVLLAGLYARGLTTVVEPQLSRDHTERMLADFGVPVMQQELTLSVTGPANLKACEVHVPGDFSSAAFFIAAALITPDSELTIKNIGLNPTRIGFVNIINQMGANIAIQYHDLKSSEPRGDITVLSSQLQGIEITPDQVPQMIDEIPILAVIATQAHGTTRLYGAKELRVKESDRLRAIVNNLTLMGVQIEEHEDGFLVTGPQKLVGTHLNSYHDHRIAMAFSIAGLIAQGTTQIEHTECVGISMPNFYQLLQGIIVD